jgi:hypothetical protein
MRQEGPRADGWGRGAFAERKKPAQHPGLAAGFEAVMPQETREAQDRSGTAGGARRGEARRHHPSFSALLALLGGAESNSSRSADPRTGTLSKRFGRVGAFTEVRRWSRWLGDGASEAASREIRQRSALSVMRAD